MIASIVFLEKCINIDTSLKHHVKKCLQEKRTEMKEYAGLLQTLKDRIIEDKKSEGMNLVSWLQIEQKRDKTKKKDRKCAARIGSGGLIDKKQFIDRFSEWERLLLLLVEGGEGFRSEQSMNERIRTAVLDGARVTANLQVELDDSNANSWGSELVVGIKSYREMWSEKNNADELEGTGEGQHKGGGSLYKSQDMVDIYVSLSDYRNLLQVQEEIGAAKKSYVDGSKEALGDMFAVFLTYLSMEIACTLPRIEIFFPAGRFWNMNFYNTRFENSSFRMSSFRSNVFARSKIKNCNFSMSAFEMDEFFGVDCRDGSLSNTLMKECKFREAVFEDVDFTGAVMKDCDLEKAAFRDCFLVNMQGDTITLNQTDFTNSRISGIILNNTKRNQLNQCNFTNASLSAVVFETEKDGDRRSLKHTREEIRRELVRGKEGDASPDRLGKLWQEIKKSKKTEMRECIFTDAVLEGFSLSFVDAEQSVFSGTQMKEVHLYAVSMPGCIMNGANMREGRFYLTDMRSAVLNDAIFYRARVGYVNLEDASLCSLHASDTGWNKVNPFVKINFLPFVSWIWEV